MKHAVVVLFAIASVGLIAARAAGWVPFSWLETAGVVTGAACVLLVVRRSIWNFPVGIASCAAYLVFFAEGRLYADAGLQVVFILLGIHGWVAWVRGRTDSTPIRRVPLGELTALAVAFPAVWLGLTRLLEHVNGAAPICDAFVTALSLVSQWLLNRRYVESWLGWIVVDQVAVFLFWSRDMHLTAVLYALFLVMCVAGLVEWRRNLAKDTAMKTRGLVIGKFYPPHRGHKLLIDTAASTVDELHVIVCDKPGEDPPAILRAEWLREIHPTAKVWMIDDRYDADDSAVWAQDSTRLLGFTPDVVFTSEDYGERFAACLGCEHVLVDRARNAVPVSGTADRADPLGCWDFLEPPVRGHYARRVVLIGAESTGKTTLATDLAAEFGTLWLPEYGREYWERKMARGEPNTWRTEEFADIAREQCRREDAAARLCNRVLVCDTDAFTTRVWHHRYMGTWSPEVDAIAAEHRQPDLYLLTDVNTPFEQDGTRDGELIREWMHRTFAEELVAHGRPFVELSGSRAERLAVASTAIRRLCATRIG